MTGRVPVDEHWREAESRSMSESERPSLKVAECRA